MGISVHTAETETATTPYYMLLCYYVVMLCYSCNVQSSQITHGRHGATAVLQFRYYLSCHEAAARTVRLKEAAG